MQQDSGGLSQRHGVCRDLYVGSMPGEERYVLGSAQKARAWAHVLTPFAAQMLWVKLTNYLYPEKSRMLIGLASTAPLREPHHATITTRIEVVHESDGWYSLVGWIEDRPWSALLDETEARRLWARLDEALFPVGWEGRHSSSSSPHRPPN